MKKEEIKSLEKISNTVRNSIIDMLYEAKSGHPGGSLSVADIITVIYFNHMNLNLDTDGKRIDKFVLSKGHCAPALYAVLAEKGFIEKDDLKTLRKVDSYLEGHPSNKINGIDVSSGSLGQGISIASGLALSKKLDKKEGYVYCVLGDGEIEEGQVYEALMTISKYNLNNLIVIIDNNGYQIDGSVKDVKNLNNIDNKIHSFGFNILNVDGHDLGKIDTAINKAKSLNTPTCIICKTVKGKGVSFMENDYRWHGKAMNEEEYKIAKKDLN